MQLLVRVSLGVSVGFGLIVFSPGSSEGGSGVERILAPSKSIATTFTGFPDLRELLEGGLVQPMSLAAGDLDEDGVPDLVVGYGAIRGGVISVQRGNVDAIYPNAPEARARKRARTYLDSAFLPEASLFGVDEAPGHLAVGDFDADGHFDVAAVGSGAIFWHRGDGEGNLGPAERIEFSGQVTAAVSGEVNRRDGLLDLVVAVDGAGGASLLVFEGPEGALRREPESIAMDGPAVSLALGWFSEDEFRDVAAAVGEDVVLIRGRDRKLSHHEEARAAVLPPIVDRWSSPVPPIALAAGDFFESDGPEDELAVAGDDGSLLFADFSGGPDAGHAPVLVIRESGSARNLDFAGRSLGVSSNAPPIRLSPARVSGRAMDDLLVFGSNDQGLEMIVGAAFEDEVGVAATFVRTTMIFETESAPIALLPMRLNPDARHDLVLLQSGKTAAAVAPTISATMTVNSTADPGTGVCDATECTLREAIAAANAAAGADTIDFNIGGGGVRTITPASALPTITGPVTIDGTTQPGFAGAPLIQLDGVSAGTTSYGIRISAGSSAVRGLAIYRFGGATGFVAGIRFESAGGNIAEGNYLGTNNAAASGLGNRTAGLEVSGSPGNTIGGTVVAARNVIVRNTYWGVYVTGAASTGAVIVGNFVGVNPNGTTTAGNSSRGVDVALAPTPTIGGTAAGSANVISGNPSIGLYLNGSSTTGALVQGNFVGTDLAGALDLGNGDGIILNSPGAAVGGTSPAARNIISGNNSRGLLVNLGAPGAVVRGNYIGTNAAGTSTLGNSNRGIQSAASCTIGGTTVGAGNLVSGNLGDGLYLSAPSVGADVLGNLIGTDVTGTLDLGNSGSGVRAFYEPGTRIGGSGAGAANVISGNTGSGVSIDGFWADVQGNRIGTQIDGVTPLGNSGSGIMFSISATGSRIGGTTAASSNTIANNSFDGVYLSLGAGTANAIRRNSIHSNGELGIDIYPNGTNSNDFDDYDSGENRLQNFPEIDCAEIDLNGDLVVRYSVSSNTTQATYPLAVDFYEPDSIASREGRSFLATDSYSTSDYAAGIKAANLGNAASLGFVPGDVLVATATDAQGNSSEFSLVGYVSPPLSAPTQLDVKGIACGGSITTPDRSPTLSWSNEANEVGYRWEVWMGPGCTGGRVALGSTGVNMTTATVSPLLANGTYYWRVRSLGNGVNFCSSDWTCGCPFTIDCPPLVAPVQTLVDTQACGGAITAYSSTPTLDWDPVASAVGYVWEVWNAADCGGTMVASGATGSGTTSATVSPALPSGSYSWRVRATGDDEFVCTGPWSCTCPFTVPCPPLPSPAQSSVAGQACGGAITTNDATPTLGWIDTPNESSYAWELYDGISCSGTLLESGTAGMNASSVTVTTELGSGLYSWRIRAVGDGAFYCDSGWSCGCYFQVSCPTIAAPSLFTVAGESCAPPVSTADRTPSLVWSNVANETGYEWEIWNGPGCTGAVVESGMTGPDVTTGAPVGDLPYGTYSWRVRSLADGVIRCDSEWSCGCTFTIQCPTLAAPPQTSVFDGVTTYACGPYISIATTTPTLNWTDVADETGYEWEVWTGILCSGTLVASGSMGPGLVSAIVSPALSDNTTYHWRVRAVGDGVLWCASAWTCGCPFTVGAPSCSTTSLASPTIAVDTTWTLAGSPYLVSGTLTIDPGVTLDVDPGVIVKYLSGASAVVNGTLRANGTATDRVVFTSINDNAACGLSTGSSGTPSAGDWSGIQLSTGSSMTMAYSVVRYATTALQVETSLPVTVDDSTIEDCWTGVETRSTSSTVFTNVNLTRARLWIRENSRPSFTGGVWDGGGFLNSPGEVEYCFPMSSNTPDPSFSGITIQNMGPGGHEAVDIIDEGTSGIEGATHWRGVPFWIWGTTRVAATGRVDASNTTVSFAAGFGSVLENSGILNLGLAGEPAILQSGSPTPASGDWTGVRYIGTSSGTITNTTIRHATTGLQVETTGALAVGSSTIEDCWGGVVTQSTSSPVFTDVNLTRAQLWIGDNSRPSFTGGVWDGGGFQYSPGAVEYGFPMSGNTPDPSFSGITIQNMSPGGHEAVDIFDGSASGIEGATHWRGVPFWIGGTTRVAATGRVDASNTTVSFEAGFGIELENSGILNLGLAGKPAILRSGSPTPASGDWTGLRYIGTSSGAITNTTIRHATTGLQVETTGALAVGNSTIEDCWGGVVTQSTSSPVFTNVNLTRAQLWIGDNSRPSFTGGVWDGGGFLNSPGAVEYGFPMSGNTPDPSFSGITIQNMSPGGHQGVDILDGSASGIEGATHWRGVPFWIGGTTRVAATGRVDASNTTVSFAAGFGTGLENSGILNLGLAGEPAILRSGSSTPASGDWTGVRYIGTSSGAITNTTIRHAMTGVRTDSIGVLSIGSSRVEECFTGLESDGLASPSVASTAFENDSTCIRALGASTPDLGGGAQLSPGYNTLIGSTMSFDNQTSNSLFARSNWWGCPTTLEMDVPVPNITLINDFADNPALGAVDYTGYLGTMNRVIQQVADTSGGKRDVVVSWPAEPTGTLQIFRGNDPTSLSIIGTTSGASWTDVGGLDLPDPTIYYRIDGPCP